MVVARNANSRFFTDCYRPAAAIGPPAGWEASRWAKDYRRRRPRAAAGAMANIEVPHCSKLAFPGKGLSSSRGGGQAPGRAAPAMGVPGPHC